MQRITRAQAAALRIAICGKYTELHDAYISVAEALKHAGVFHNVDVDLHWVNTESIEQDGAEPYLHGVDGIVVPGGFGDRGVQGKMLAARYAREQRDALPGPVLRHADGGDRAGPRICGLDQRQLAPRSTRAPPTR